MAYKYTQVIDDISEVYEVNNFQELLVLIDLTNSDEIFLGMEGGISSEYPSLPLYEKYIKYFSTPLPVKKENTH